MTRKVARAEFWEGHYQAHRAPWDLGGPAPAIAAWLRSNPGQGRRLLVPGSGRGHDAIACAEAGYAVTGVDFAPTAIAEAQSNADAQGVHVEWLAADLFGLPEALNASFDVVVEHTCFCAIDPAMRPHYAEVVQGLLKPGGRFVGVFFTHGEPGGPPFDTTPDEIRRVFSPHFEIETLIPSRYGVPERLGQETWAEMTWR